MATLQATGDAAATMPAGARPPVDHDHLARYTFGNKALEIEVLNLFAEQVPEYLGRLHHAATEKDWRDAAHTLKGSAMAVGAVRVAELAERAEALCHSADAGARGAVLAALAEAIDEVRSHIAGLDRQH